MMKKIKITPKQQKILNISLISLVLIMGGIIVYILGFAQSKDITKDDLHKEVTEKSYTKAELDSILRLRSDSLSAMYASDSLFEQTDDKRSSMTKGEVWWCNLPDAWKGIFRKKMHITEDDFPTNHQIANLTNTLEELDISTRKKVASLKPLKMLRNLVKLNCSNTSVRSLEPLAGLTNLTSLKFSDTQISDLSPIKGLKELRVLEFENAKVTSLAPLKNLYKLNKLNCSINHIKSLQDISELSQIVELNCSGNKIKSLKAVSEMVNLKLLNCSNTQVSNLMPLFNLEKIEVLYCFNTKIKSIEALYNLEKLKIFYYNNIEEKEIEEFRTANPECTVLLRKKQ